MSAISDCAAPDLSPIRPVLNPIRAVSRRGRGVSAAGIWNSDWKRIVSVKKSHESTPESARLQLRLFPIPSAPPPINPKTDIPTTKNPKFHQKDRVCGISQPTPLVAGWRSCQLFNFCAFRGFRGSLLGIRDQSLLARPCPPCRLRRLFPRRKKFSTISSVPPHLSHPVCFNHAVLANDHAPTAISFTSAVSA